MTIHDDDPFAVPVADRDQLRRFRGRLGPQVTLWTSGEGATRSGLTVSSTLVALGEPGAVLGLLDPDSDLADALVPGARLVVQLLEWRHRNLAEQFAGTMPAPGGAFNVAEFESTAWGPRLVGAGAWLGAEVRDVRAVGWSSEIWAEVQHVEVGAEQQPLLHRRGRYVQPAPE